MIIGTFMPGCFGVALSCLFVLVCHFHARLFWRGTFMPSCFGVALSCLVVLAWHFHAWLFWRGTFMPGCFGVALSCLVVLAWHFQAWLFWRGTFMPDCFCAGILALTVHEIQMFLKSIYGRIVDTMCPVLIISKENSLENTFILCFADLLTSQIEV